MGHKPRERFYAGGFLYDPGAEAVLLHLRDGNTAYNPNKWAFFGGRSEGAESPEDCFIREVKEELGIDLNRAEIVPLCDYLNENEGVWRYVFYAKSNLPVSAMRLTEGEDLRWIPLEKVFEYDLTDRVRADLTKFVELVR